MKKIVLRKCIVTNNIYPKDKLLRVTKTKDGLVKFDSSYHAPGRGAYILKSKDAIELARKRHVLDKAFSVKVDEKIYDELLKEIM